MFGITFEVIDRGDGCWAGSEAEAALLDLAAAGRAVASLWEAPSPALLAPRSYRRYERFKEVGAEFARRDMPVLLRQSGGGLVPQGPGILNVSVAFALDGRHARSGEWIYESLCELMQDALATLGVDAEPRAVAGSFCDGRFNLAVGGRKIAGTAQYWKPLSPGRPAVLAHALLLVDIDPEVAVGWANAFEAALGTGRAYDPDAVTSVVRCLPDDRAGLVDAATLRDQVRDALLLALGQSRPNTPNRRAPAQRHPDDPGPRLVRCGSIQHGGACVSEPASTLTTSSSKITERSSGDVRRCLGSSPSRPQR